MRDIQFKSFSIQNFLSIGNEPVEIVFTPGLHLITGHNKDKDGRRNGVGKSTIMDAIHWVLFGSPLRDINKATIANFNTKGACTGTIEFGVTLNGKTSNYKIVRTLAPSKCFLYVDEVDKTLSTVPKTSELIEHILGFTSPLFKNSVILSINNSQAFLAQDKVTKRKFIEGIFNLEVFGSILADVRTRSVETKKQIEISTTKVDAKKQNVITYTAQRDVFEQNRVSKLKEQNEMLFKYKKQLEDTVAKLVNEEDVTAKQSELRTRKRTILEHVSALEKQIEQARKKIWEDQALINTTKKDIDTYIKEVKTHSDNQIVLVEREKADYLKDLKVQSDTAIALIERELDKYITEFKNQTNTKIVVLQNTLQDYIKSTQATICPTCKRPLKEKIEPDQSKISAWEKELGELKSSTPETEKLSVFAKRIEEAKRVKPDSAILEAFTKKVEVLKLAQPDQEKIRKLETVIVTTDAIIVESNKSVDEAQKKANRFNTEGISKIDEALDKLQAVVNKNNQVKVEVEFCNRQLLQVEKQLQETTDAKNTFVDMLTTANKDFETYETELKDHQKMYAIYESAKYIVSEEGVKAFIVKKLLSVLNDRIDYYLRKLDSNSTCVFNEFFEETIKNDKGVECSYFNFSGAEMKTIDLACLFAFMDLRRMQGDVAINISMYDELFDSSFDEKGLEHVVEILKERVYNNKEAVFVISHRKESLKAATGEIITLEKQNGVTRRVKNA